MATSSPPAHLEPSALGRKEYWDEAYTLELANHKENSEDEGTIWFSDSGAEEKVLEYLEILDMVGNGSGDVNMEDTSLRMLDLGTGNGHLLFELRDAGWQAEMVGVDYSQHSVQLAKQIQARRQNEVIDSEEELEEQSKTIEFEHFDILDGQPGHWLGGGFDIVLDKGTFDAISLSDEVDAQGRKGCERYGSKVSALVKRGGYLVVTSCNWTEAELRKWFESPELAYHETIRFPTFTFGGVKGQTVSSICFRRSAAA